MLRNVGIFPSAVKLLITMVVCSISGLSFSVHMQLQGDVGMVQCRTTLLFATPTYHIWAQSERENIVASWHGYTKAQPQFIMRRGRRSWRRGRRETVGEDLKVVAVELVEVHSPFPHVS